MFKKKKKKARKSMISTGKGVLLALKNISIAEGIKLNKEVWI